MNSLLLRFFASSLLRFFASSLLRSSASSLLHFFASSLLPASLSYKLARPRLSSAAISLRPGQPMLSRDDRRRRLLTEGVLGASGDAEAAGGSPGPSASRRSARYAKAADMSHQPRITDLVPQRKLILWLWCFLGAAMVAGLEALYWWMPQVAAMTRDGRVAAFDLDGEGSLGAWFTSLMLGMSALTAVLIYTLRRHRLDDYRGRYRLWLWAAACFFVMSVDEAGSLHEGFKEMMFYFTAERLYGDGSAWWVIAYGSVLGLVGLFILWDLRESWFSALSFLATGGAYATAVATQLGFLLPERGARAVMLEEGCEMLGAMMLLLSLATYARHIIREIEGVSGKRTRKVKRKAERPTALKSATKTSAAKTDGGTASTTLTASSSASPAAAKVESRPASAQLRKDPPHATPTGPAAKTVAPAANKAKFDRKGR
jgi:hypothetical protein